MSEGRRESKARLPTSRKASRFRSLGLSNPLFSGALLLAFLGALLALLISDFRYTEAGLSDNDVGTIAERNYRAARDFTFSRIDAEATRTARNQRASEVPPVYRWEVEVATSARRRIREAFLHMRRGIDQVRLETRANLNQLDPPPQQPPDPPPVESITVETVPEAGMFGVATGVTAGVLIGPDNAVVPDTGDPAGDAATNPAAPPGSAEVEEIIDAAIDNWAFEQQDAFEQRLGIVVEPGTFKLLVDHRFGPRIEQDLLDLVESVLERQVARDLTTLQTHIAPLQRDGGAAEQKPLLMVYRRENGEDTQPLPEYTIATVLDTVEARRVVGEEAANRLSDRTVRERSRLTGLARQFIEPNLVYDRALTEEAREAARESVRDLVVQQEFKQGQIIVDEGHVVTAEHLDIWREMTGEQRTTSLVFWGAIGLGIFLCLLLVAVGYLLRSDLWNSRYRPRDIVFLCVSLLVMTVVLRVGEAVLLTVAEAWQWNVAALVVLMLPFAAGPMMLRLVQGGEVAVVFGVLVAMIAALVVELPSVIVPYILITSIVGAVTLRRTKTRMMVLSAGVLVGLISAACALGLVMFELRTTEFADLAVVSGLAVTSGVLSAIAVTVTLPIVESLFGYTTDIKLLELANLEHPALRDLILKAPGTYQHSMMVGSLNEAAAEAIGANALLARVGAYYHDIGKMKNAQYFAENQQGDNPHGKLKPNMSALILKAHVKDGIEMARSYKLPQDIVDFIATHHGTSRIEYFYHKAREQESPDIPEVREEDYRYPGPKPQSRETGICMIADTVEAAARALPEKTPARLKLLVNKLINHKFADGQFDECDLTLRDLNMIAEAMLRILTAVYHHRPKYPDKKKEPRERDKDAARTEARGERDKGERDKGDKGGDRADHEPRVPASAELRVRPSSSAAIERAVEVARAAIADRTEAGAAGTDAKSRSRKPTPPPEHEQSLASMVMERTGVPDSLILGPDPDAPVGRIRTDRSGSGEHQKIDPALMLLHGADASPLEALDQDDESEHEDPAEVADDGGHHDDDTVEVPDAASGSPRGRHNGRPRGGEGRTDVKSSKKHDGGGPRRPADGERG